MERTLARVCVHGLISELGVLDSVANNCIFRKVKSHREREKMDEYEVRKYDINEAIVDTDDITTDNADCFDSLRGRVV